MLGDYTPAATLAVKDLAAATAFYDKTLGLTRRMEFEGGVFYNAGDGAVFVYQSEFAGTNKATSVTFGVPSEKFDQEVNALRTAGVTFETFEGPGMEWNDGVATMQEDMGRAVWFKDPDGNFLNVNEMPTS
ncbi:VOC family protein [Raineyella fluvialis]|uniref:VOC family protein n=1 Tax=Raineyella fluvialis TaxID=2662261 RepID=A0A5Q2FAG5_9ACTN|nr:VOC family protein [Raineyella fluvialis]QGF23799.1 VOC family protein [Raineyella fluvialis]